MRHEAQDVVSAKAVNDEKVDLANAKRAFSVLESRASPDRSAMRSAILERDGAQNELVTTPAKLQVAKGLLLLRLTRVRVNTVTPGRLRLLCKIP